MAKRLLYLAAYLLIMLAACNTTRKTGCPSPRKNWGAEKVLEEMSRPVKK